MSFNKILIPVDGSAFSEKALETGAEFAKLANSEVTLFYVKDRTVYVQSVAGTKVSDIDHVLEAEKNNIMTDAAKIMEKAGVRYVERDAEGVPGKEIIAISGDFDLIIMGTAGRSGLKKMIMGSVTAQVAVNAKCPVMSVRVVE